MNKTLSALIIGILIGVIGIIFIYLYITHQQDSSLSTVDDCLKLGSNYRTDLCLEKLNQENAVPTPSPAFFPIDELELKYREMKKDSNYVNNPTLNMTIANNSDSLTVKNIILKVTFYREKQEGCDGTPDDTQYIQVNEILYPRDVKTTSGTVTTAFDTSRGFNYCVQITNAYLL